MPIEALLFRRDGGVWTVAALATIAAVGVVDYLTGPEISFSLFYLVPVAVCAWVSGTSGAVAASSLAALAWLSAEVASSRIATNLFVYTWNFAVRLLFLLLVALLLARLRDILVRERELSRTDALTGLLNARAFRELVEREIARAARYGHPLTLAFIDVDDFKRVNDSGGHAAGDRLLRHIAKAISANLRGSDAVARYGGDEFVVLLPVADEAAARATVAKLAERIRAGTAELPYAVTVSIGAVSWRGDGASVDLLLEKADRLMYEVKTASKDGARFATLAGP